jgi:hypothetical protein
VGPPIGAYSGLTMVGEGFEMVEGLEEVEDLKRVEQLRRKRHLTGKWSRLKSVRVELSV